MIELRGPDALPLPALSQKEAIWLACKAKTCCYSPFVVPTGRDVWRIARALDTPPDSFLFYFPAPQPRRDAFVLDRSGACFRLALGKGAARRKGGQRPCIFLLRTRSGHHRCGLGALRPIVCRAALCGLEDGVLSVDGAACSCRAWGLADVDLDEEMALLTARQQDAEEYCQVVARWNEQVMAGAPEERYSVADFCAYLLHSYDQLAAAGARR